MAATATPPRIGSPRKTPFARSPRPRATVAMSFRLEDIEDRDISDAQLGRWVRAIVLANAYGRISPALLSMRTGTSLETAAAELRQLVDGGSLQAGQVTGSSL